MRVNTRDLAAGAIFIAIGLFFALDAWLNLRMGEAFSMGPGYFPVLLGSILIAFGIAIAVTAIGKPKEVFGRVSWRGVFLVVASIVFFAATVRGFGMALALGGAGLMASLSTKKNTIVQSLVVSACITVFSILVFIYGLRLPYPVIGPWLGG